ncbi:GNAT family N-acetyltransferase [Paracoccaceae bacterium GXU_MW_L88]
MTPELTTDRLTLRAPRMSDSGLLAHYASDKQVAWNTTSIPHPYPKGAAEAFLTRKAAAVDWVIDGTISELDEFLGLITLAGKGDETAEIGYFIAPIFWGTGIASEAVQRVVDHARKAGIKRLVASVFQDNPASAKVLSKAGFAYTGDDEAFSVARGAMVPRWRYALDLNA